MSAMQLPSVVIGYVHGSYDVALFHTSLRKMREWDYQRECPLIADEIEIEASPRIAHFRNQLVTEFLKTPYPWLLMLDADMLMPRDLVDRLLSHANPSDRPIVAGLYFGGRLQGKQHAQIFRLRADGQGLDSVEGVGGPGQWGPLIQIHAAGAGCLLIHRSALERIGETNADSGFPWFVEGRGSMGDGGIDIGEDIAFCLRACHLNIPIWADTSTILGHCKIGVLDETTHAAYLMDRDVLGDEGVARSLTERLRFVEPERQPHE